MEWVKQWFLEGSAVGVLLVGLSRSGLHSGMDVTSFVTSSRIGCYKDVTWKI